MLYLRIIFTILSALCIAALIPLGALFGWAWVGYCFFGALLFFVLMLLCKQSQDIKALKSGENAPSPTQQASTPPQEDSEPKETDKPARAKGATPKK